MKRLFTFLALCCLVVTGAWAQGMTTNANCVTALPTTASAQSYVFTTPRGALLCTESQYLQATDLPANNSAHTFSTTDAAFQFLLFPVTGEESAYYVYSVGARKFLGARESVTSGSNTAGACKLSDTPVKFYIWAHGQTGSTSQGYNGYSDFNKQDWPYTIGSEKHVSGNYQTINLTHWNNAQGYDFGSTSNIDGGNAYAVISAATVSDEVYKAAYNAIYTFDPAKTYTLRDLRDNRGYIAYNPASTTYVGLADVTLNGYADKHPLSTAEGVGINWTITENGSNRVTFYCQKNGKYIAANGNKAVWSDNPAEFTYVKNTDGTFSFLLDGDNTKYLHPSCGWSPTEGPVCFENHENCCDFTITEIEEPAPVDPDVVVPATGYYYIKDKSNGGQYLYNNSITSEGTTALAQTLSGSKVENDNRYLWHVVSDGTSTSITLTNGQGTGYKASGTDETHTVDLASVNWEFEELGKITVSHEGAPSTQEYPAHLVRVLYASTSEEHYKVLKEGYITYKVGGNASIMQYAHDGGFLVDRTSSNWMSSSYGYGDMSHVTCDEDGLKFTKCLVKNLLGADGFLHIYYYTQKDEDLIEVLIEKMLNFMLNTDDLGYVRYEDIPEFPDEFDGTELTYPLIVAMMAGYDAYEYKDALGRYNKLVASVDVVKPEAGKAYKLYVKNEYVDKDGDATKYYLANDHLTTNKDEAEVYVVGSTDDEDCSLLFASNSNSACNYLPNMSNTGSAYAADKCDYMMKGMAQVTGENIEEQPAYLYGSFLIKNAEGKVLNVVTGTSASLDLRTTPCVTYGENSTETSAFYLEEVDYPYNKPVFAYGSPDDHDGGYASIWLPFPMVFPEGVEAYRATNVENDGILILTKVNEGNTVAAGGYILRTPEQTTDTDPDDVDNLPLVLPAPAAPNDVTPCEDNAFVGSTENPSKEKEPGSWSAFLEAQGNPTGTPYVLAKKNRVIGYYKYNDGADDRLPKGKAIWFSNYTADAECVQFSFDDIISAIEALHGNTGDNEIFDLQGRRLDKAEKGQVNVINGKKVMFK